MADQEGRKALADLLIDSFEIYPAYGRDPESAGKIVKTFMMVLGDYDIHSIRDAFKFHLENNRQFPVPADIAHIIRRGNKPPFQESVYIAMQRKEPDVRTHQEWSYIREYESYMRTGKY